MTLRYFRYHVQKLIELLIMPLYLIETTRQCVRQQRIPSTYLYEFKCLLFYNTIPTAQSSITTVLQIDLVIGTRVVYLSCVT